MSFHISFTIRAILLFLASLLARTSSQRPKGSIHISLIHHDSSLSPFYNPQESPYDRVRSSFVRSKARLSYLINTGDGANDFQGEIEANDGEYFVKFSAGTPAVELVAAVDTASELILARCFPCSTCNGIPTIPMFDSSKSLTYMGITCSSSNCTRVPSYACDPSSLCSFIYGYADFSHSNSYLGSDIFTFETSDGGIFPLENAIFGCKYDHEGTPVQYNGILGLGLHDLSLIKQMSSMRTQPQFTYCLGNHSDPESENRLILGNGIFQEGQTTSLRVIDGRYNLVLNGVSIGKKRLSIPTEVFQPSSSGGGVIIDTGTLLTFLDPDAYDVLMEELERQLNLVIEVWSDPPYERCYNGKLNDLKEFQGVIFHFDGDVNVLLDVQSLFLQVEDEMFCLAVLPSPVRGASVIGTLFQQFYSIGYHLDEMLLSFQRIDCEVLENHLSS